MKYIVTVNGEDHEVLLDGAQASMDGEVSQAQVAELEGTPIRLLTIGDTVHRVVARRTGTRGSYDLWIDGHRFSVEALDERSRAIRELSRKSQGALGPAPLIAPMPGLVVRVNVAVGDSVQAGQGLVVMEAMKMENELRAPAAGTVRQVHATPGTAVEKGTVLIELE